MNSAATAPIIDRVREMTRQARERHASKLLTLEAVHEAMSAAAGEGYHTVTIAPSLPVDLMDTPTAKDTAAQLKKEGLRVEWEKRTRPDGPPWHVLVVTW